MCRKLKGIAGLILGYLSLDCRSPTNRWPNYGRWQTRHLRHQQILGEILGERVRVGMILEVFLALGLCEINPGLIAFGHLHHLIRIEL